MNYIINYEMENKIIIDNPAGNYAKNLKVNFYKLLIEQNFINTYENWACIQHFADYLLTNEQTHISCEEASAVIDQFLKH